MGKMTGGPAAKQAKGGGPEEATSTPFTLALHHVGGGNFRLISKAK